MASCVLIMYEGKEAHHLIYALNNLCGVRLYVSMSQKRKPGFRDVGRPAEDHTQRRNHEDAKPRLAPSQHTGFLTKLPKLHCLS